MDVSKITPVVVHQIPRHLRENYPEFVEFIKNFYEFLESDGNFLNSLEKFLEGSEANAQITPYIHRILKECGWEYFERSADDQLLIINTLREFYLNRGNLASLEYLFRVLFNESVSINYPRDRLFILSGSEYKWNTQVIVKVDGQFKNFIQDEGIMTGLVSEKTATVSEVRPYWFQNSDHLIVDIDERVDFIPWEGVVINMSGTQIGGQILPTLKVMKIPNSGHGFKPGQLLRTLDSDLTESTGVLRVKAVKPGKVESVRIVQKGQNYRVGDSVRVKRPDTSGGAGFYAQVQVVNLSGGIEKIKIINTGWGFKSLPELDIISGIGRGAVLLAESTTAGGILSVDIIEPFWNLQKIGPVGFYSLTGKDAKIEFNSSSCEFETVPRFENERHILGSNAILHDSLYYQEYSYEINSEVSPKAYHPIVAEQFHPAGLMPFHVYHLNLNLGYDTIFDYDKCGFVESHQNATGEVFLFDIVETIILNSYDIQLSTVEIQTVKRLGVLNTTEIGATAINSFKEKVED